MNLSRQVVASAGEVGWGKDGRYIAHWRVVEEVVAVGPRRWWWAMAERGWLGV